MPQDQREIQIRRQFILLFLLVGAASLSYGILVARQSQVAQVGTVLFALFCIVAAVIFYLYDMGSGPIVHIGFNTRDGSGDVSVRPTELGRPLRTSKGISPIIREKTDPAMEDSGVKTVSDRFLAIVAGDGDATKKYQSAAEYLHRHRAEVRVSWRLTANLARTLALAGSFGQAQEIAEALLEKFGDNPEAEAAYHEIIILCLDSRTPDRKGRLRSEMLSRQMRHVELGLAASPERVSLLLDGFDIAIDRGSADIAETYLKRAFRVDADAAKRGVANSIKDNPEVAGIISAVPKLRAIADDMDIDLRVTTPNTDPRRT
jgi:hypothetical protein